jgi:hypothetical protein
MIDHDQIKAVEVYKGVRVQDCQPRDRIETIVKPAIDDAMAIEDPYRLYEFMENDRNPPEARLLAGARLEAVWELAASERRVRPDLDMDRARALTAALDSRTWRDLTNYGGLLCLAPPASQWRDIARPPEFQEAVRRDQEELRAEERAAQAKRRVERT